MDRILSEFQLKELFKNRRFDSRLKTVSGKSVEIIQTGSVNSDTGPDFRGALVKINGIMFRGDIELHRISSDWYAHNHHRDRNYNSVVLHVVDKCDNEAGCMTEAGRKIETLELARYLSADYSAFLSDLGSEERLVVLRCSGDNRRLSVREKAEYLRVMGERRFIHKAGKFEERLKDIIDENRPVVFEDKQRYFRDFGDLRIEHRSYEPGELRTESYWDQLLYEGIMEGLGYSKNTGPFRKLARNLPLNFLRENCSGDGVATEAALFGAAGLIPDKTDGMDPESSEYCSRLAAAWRGFMKKYRREMVDRSEWLFFKLRPQNFPTIRIAGAGSLLGGWLLSGSCGETMSGAAEKNDRSFMEVWRKILIVPARGYWTRHYVFGSAASMEIRMLIGAGRAEEIIINTILPLTYLRGQIYKSQAVGDQAKRVYEDHPAVTDNMVTLIMKENLFGGDNVLGTVAAQQGALHLYRNFCSERRCERCRIGKALYGKPAA